MKSASKTIQQKVRAARKGLSIFYYGKGKGKTTAAMGLAARAAGSGMNVFILQFVKSHRPKKGHKRESGEWPISSEIIYFEEMEKNPHKKSQVGEIKIGSIANAQVGLGFVGILGDKKEKAQHVKEAKRGLALAQKLISSDQYDLVVLDELISALELRLLTEKEILQLIKSKPKHLHLAYTGHDFYKNVVAVSDMVSEINMIKHPYYKGILAQKGIDF